MMEQDSGLPAFLTSEPDQQSPFTVLVAYEDLDTGKQAKRTCDILEQRLGLDFKLSTQMWKFDVLNIPKLREMATNDAISADLLMLSMHGEHDLPDAVKDWIDAWLAQGARAIALVALLQSERENPQPARPYLREVARRGGLEFFAPSEKQAIAGQSRPELSITRVSDIPIELAAPAANDFVPAQRWGLNE
jgi:hypothetical protein